jgi:UDP-N-acetylmuramoyl-L-alanyl-D-glutamate--2,6-diaminopimelate ligase
MKTRERKLKDLLEGVETVRMQGSPDTPVQGLCADSRQARRGDLFFALPGEHTDGHRFIPAALQRGVAAVIAERAGDWGECWIQTPDCLEAMARISAAYYERPAEELNLIAITGSNGKSTCTYLTESLLKEAGRKTGMLTTIEYRCPGWTEAARATTPLSIDLHRFFRQMADAGATDAVMEVSSHGLALKRVLGVEFHTALFTNLSQDHLDFHKTMDEYAAAKARLFKQSVSAVINLDDAYAPVMTEAAEAAGCHITTFSMENDQAGLVAKRIRISADRVEFCALTMEKLQKIELGIPAMFTVYNALAAAATGLALGFEIEAVAAALAGCKGIKGRIEVVPTGRDFTVIIDYAHKPFALENIIRTFKALETGRVVTLFGCGGDRDKTKRPLMGEIAARLSDFVVVTSDNPRTEEPGAIIEDILSGMKGTKTPYIVIENRKDAIGWVLKNAQPNDIILLAGKGHETYQIIGKQKYPFDEREIVRAFLAAE